MSVSTRERRSIRVRGIVQGVGFRPFIYSLARRYGLSGFVLNDAAGVEIEAEGAPEAVERFIAAIAREAPPLARVENVTWQPLPSAGDAAFRIAESLAGAQVQTLIAPDSATCAACLRELFDPADRRYRYPFINCTNCGPRFTITRTVPYDRPTTTMAGFVMCAECRREYENPANRRFHAQPNACQHCGPHVRLVDRSGAPVALEDGDAVVRTAQLLKAGAVVAIKGLGGYHLACDPFNADAVRTLRARKVRQDKAFALMAADVPQVRTLCEVGPEEERLLTSVSRPIVLLQRRPASAVADGVAPRQRTLGVMLAYTPLHYLLLHDTGTLLVMTSGNRSDEPVAYCDDEAFAQLCEIADYFLVHDRPIHMRCDDSVMRLARRDVYPVRRSRGYAPAPLTLPEPVPVPTLACGAELKNTFCIAQGDHAFLSHHIGDLENYETLRSFREGIEHFCRIFDVQPRLVAYDLHPDYLSTKYAREMEDSGAPVVGIQHHHAHIASCLADNARPSGEHVTGVALDGTGFGTDGAIWGGEFLEGSLQAGFRRAGHLVYTPLPGGAAAIREPWRVALAHLIGLCGEEAVLRSYSAPTGLADERTIRAIARVMQAGLNSPLTSSAGRLFDAVAALLQLPGTRRTTYEGQAAVELELVADGATNEHYPVEVTDSGDGWVVQTAPIIAGVLDDLRGGRAPGTIAARFHRTMAEVVVEGSVRVRDRCGVEVVALSGGTFHNMLLLEQSIELLQARGFTVYRHQRVPANDGGLSLGQAVLARWAYQG
jgi:hydrogenase maturation protein HypF